MKKSIYFSIALNWKHITEKSGKWINDNIIQDLEHANEIVLIA